MDKIELAYRSIVEALAASYQEEDYEIEHRAMFVLMGATGDVKVLPPPPSKDAAANIHKVMAMLCADKIVAFVDEAYRASTKKDDALTKILLEGRLAVRDLIDKEEGVMISLRFGKEQRIGWCNLDRVNKKLTSEPLVDPAKSDMKGRFV